MKKKSTKEQRHEFLWQEIKRKTVLGLYAPRFSKISNSVHATVSYLRKRTSVYHLPIGIKIDPTPLCNLHCPVCYHAKREDLAFLKFHQEQRMNDELFKKLINEVGGKSLFLSLDYLGDPLMNSRIFNFCVHARRKSLATMISSNFSFNFSDEKINQIIDAQPTQLRFCIDGLSQDIYEKTRIGGRLDLVFNNLKRVLARKHALKRRYPSIEVQYFKFPHNQHQIEKARKLFIKMGVDTFTVFKGNTINWVITRKLRFRPKTAQRKPYCWWPWLFSLMKWNGDIIPCCFHRQIHQLVTEDPEARTLGNIKAMSFKEIWKSRDYEMSRLLCLDPSLSDRSEVARNNFCYGCERLFY